MKKIGLGENRGTRDAICQIKVLAERMIRKSGKIFAYFIDYKKAFDKANHRKSIPILTKCDVPSEESRLILNLHWSQSAQIRGSSENSQSSKIEKRVKICLKCFEYVE